ncbi:hypothetical protein JOQ06_018920, partial [Pogonophryne albipinna]
MTVLPLFDYGDTIYRSACKGALDHLDVLYHSAIRFATNAPYRTHHCDLYSLANWPSLETRRNIHWLMFSGSKPLLLSFKGRMQRFVTFDP